MCFSSRARGAFVVGFISAGLRSAPSFDARYRAGLRSRRGASSFASRRGSFAFFALRCSARLNRLWLLQAQHAHVRHAVLQLAARIAIRSTRVAPGNAVQVASLKYKDVGTKLRFAEFISPPTRSADPENTNFSAGDFAFRTKTVRKRSAETR